MKIAAVALMFCAVLMLFSSFIEDEFRYVQHERNMSETLAFHFAACRNRFVAGDVFQNTINGTGSTIKDYAGACTREDTGVKVYYVKSTRRLTVWLEDSSDPVWSTASVLNSLDRLAAEGKLTKPAGMSRLASARTVGRQHIPAHSLFVQYSL